MRLPIKNQPMGRLSTAPPAAGGRRLRVWIPAAWIALMTGFAAAPLVRGEEKPAAEESPASDGEKPGAGQAKPAPSSLPPGVVARINGRDVSVEEYASYLVATLGKSKLDDYVDRLLLEEEAQRLQISVAPDQVESALDQRIERTIKSFYSGERQQFLDNLARRRTTLAEYKDRWRQRMYFDMLMEELVLRSRVVTPEALQKEFTRSYGEGGVELVLRHILVSKRLRTSEGPVRSDSEAKARAGQILKELEAGLDFVQAVKQYSDDTFTKRNEGRIVHYRKGFYGDDFDQAVSSLTTDRPRTGVVASPRGYHIVELIERRVTRFEDVKAELEVFFKTKPPTVEEKHALAARLREKAEIEGLD